MRSAILRQIHASSRPLVLARLHTKRPVSVVAAYADNSKYPAWIAKIATEPAAMESLTREHNALRDLAGCASHLRIPRVLDWDLSSGACLIQSGVNGDVDRFLIRTGSLQGVPERLRTAAAWWRTFQKSISPKRVELGALSIEIADKLEKYGSAAAIELARLLRQLAPRSKGVAAAAHGDFWASNILFSADGIGVIDWGTFAPAFPLHDLLSLLTNCWYVENHVLYSEKAAYQYVCFSNSPVARLVGDYAKEIGITGEELKLNFYGHLALRILGRGEEGRPALEQVVSSLSASGFPAPLASIA